MNKKLLFIFLIFLVTFSYAYVSQNINFLKKNPSFNIVLYNPAVNYTYNITVPLYSGILSAIYNITGLTAISSDPNHYWQMEQASGQLINKINASYPFQGTYATRKGRIGQAINITDPQIVRSTLKLNTSSSGSWTLRCWVNVSKENSGILFGGFQGTNGWFVRAYAGVWALVIKPPQEQIDFPISLNKWQYIAVQKGGSVWRLFVNDSYMDIAHADITAYNLTISEDEPSGSICCKLNATVDECALWNRKLSEAEILDDYNAGAGGFLSVSGNITAYSNNKKLWNSTAVFNSSVNAPFNTTILNDIIKDCTCQGCINNGYNCTIPIKFNAADNSVINIKPKNVYYSSSIANCSPHYNTWAFNISAKNQKTGGSVSPMISFQYDYNPVGNPAISDTHTVNLSGKSSYMFCKYPPWANFTGDMTHTFSLSGYENYNFFRYDTPYTGLYYGYMLPTEPTSATITYTILSSGNDRIEGATMRFYRTILNIITMVHEEKTDFAGNVAWYQDQQYTYLITINATGYPFKSFSLKPVSTNYEIILGTGGVSYFTVPYEGLKYRITPKDSLFNISPHYQNITLEIQSTNLQLWGINITGPYNCSPASCAVYSANPNGGSVKIGINLSNPGIFYTSIYAKYPGHDIFYLNNYPNRAVRFTIAKRSTVQMFEKIRENTTPNMRSVIVAAGSAMLVGFGASIGIFGVGLTIIVILANIFFALPAIGLINPFVMLITVIFGLAMVFIEIR